MANHTSSTDRDHPVVSAAAHVHDVLDALVELTRLSARVAELEARVAVHGDRVDVAAESGATSTACWWVHETRQTRGEAHRKTRLASALDSRERIRTALAETATHDAKALKILGRRILDIIAPEIGEAHEAKLLDAEERKADAACRFGS